MKNIILTIVAAACAVVICQAQRGDTFIYKVGKYEVVLLPEGQQQGNGSVLIGADSLMIGETMPEGRYPTAINAFLVRVGGANYLFDTGLGKMLTENLRQAGLDPTARYEIMLTHMHGDHIGGLVSEGERAFPNSTLTVPEGEYSYWIESNIENIPEAKRGGFTNARRVLDAYKNDVVKVTPAEPHDAHAEGISAIKAYGHTPGHTAYLIKSGDEQLLIWGDVAHAMAVQMQYPEVAVTYDIDPGLAVETRLAILEYVAGNKIPVAGMHIPYPGIGFVEKRPGGGYSFTPATE